MNTLRIKNDKKEIILTLIVSLLACCHIVQYYVSETIYALYVYAASLALFLYSLFYCKGRICIRNRYEVFYSILFLFMLVQTIIHSGGGNKYAGGIIESIAIYLPMITALLLINLNTETWEKIFVFTGILAVILFFYVFSHTSINLGFAINRGYQWTEIFYYTSPFCFAGAFVILSVILEKHIWLSVIVFAVDIILNLIIVKRVILIQTAVLVIVVIFLLISQKKKTKIIVWFIISLAIVFTVIMYYAKDSVSILYDSIFQRSKVVAEDINSFDRFVESQIYFSKQASITEILIGRGFSGSHNALGKLQTALHVGWSNFVLKGGILFLVIMLLPMIKAISALRKYVYLPTDYKFASVYLLYMLPLLFFGSIHSFEPSGLLFYHCCIKIMRFDSRILPQLKGRNGSVS